MSQIVKHVADHHLPIAFHVLRVTYNQLVIVTVSVLAIISPIQIMFVSSVLGYVQHVVAQRKQTVLLALIRCT